MNLLSVSKAAEYLKISRQRLYKIINVDPVPDYVSTNAKGRTSIDVDHPDFKMLVDKRTTQAKGLPGGVSPLVQVQEYGKGVDSGKSVDSGLNPEIEKLRSESRRAVLTKPILANQKIAYEVEQKKVQLDLLAGKVMTYEQGRFLFFGFFNKAASDWQRVGKKNRAILKNLVQEGDLDGVMKLYDQEIKAIITGCKTESRKLVLEWRQELKEGKK